MQLQFYGAAGEVTGSCHILTVQGRTLLLDCGMIQGGDDPDRRNREAFPFDAARLDAVLLSHAHIDHCGRLPLLRKRGFRGPVYATGACRDLARILLADSAHMAERDAERARRHPGERRRGKTTEPLFTVAEAADTLRQFEVVHYDRPTEVCPGVRVTFRDAGHILGSSSVWLDLEESGVSRRIVFSGDVGQYGSPILHDPASDGVADCVVMESTYGDRRHRDREATLAEFGAILGEAWQGGGNVLIPAFAVGRSQDLLYELAAHYEACEEIRVRARVHTLGGFSAHGDQADLLRWREGVGGRARTYLVHGENTGATGLRDALRARHQHAEIARAGQAVDLAMAA